MLDKNIDMALIGKSYPAFLFSLKLLERDQKVLLLDDKRLKYGELYTNTLCLLERKFLETWGNDNAIEPLINLEKYLVEKPSIFFIGEKRVRLGDTPARNLTELIRKFPFCFKDIKGNLLSSSIENKEAVEAFNEAFDFLCLRSAQSSYRYKDVQSFTHSSFMNHCPAKVKELFEHFFASVFNDQHNEQELWDLRTLVYMGRGFFQKKLAISGSEFEIFHLFISLLSPHYELDHQALLDDLIEVNRQKGGQFKETEVREWRFYKDRPWCMELASYEGIIHPKKISFMGSHPVDMPMQLSTQAKAYSCLNVTWKFDRDVCSSWTGERIIYSSLEKIGTDRPLWEGRFNGDKISFRVFVTKEKGSKIEFLKDGINQMLKNDLKRFIPDFDFDTLEEEMEFGPEVWVEESKIIEKKKTLHVPLPRSVTVLDTAVPGRKTKLKNVYYFGPYKEGPLGLLSSLMEIKDVQSYL